MKKVLFFFTLSLTIFTGCFFIIKSNNIIQYKNQNAYITSWHKDALQEYSVFILMQKQLQYPKNGNYKLTYVDFPRTKYIAENEFYLVNRFHFTKPKQFSKNSSYLWQVESPIKIDLNPHKFTPFFKKILFCWIIESELHRSWYFFECHFFLFKSGVPLRQPGWP